MARACIECITKRQVKNRYGHPCKINSNQLRIQWTITALNSTEVTALNCTVGRLGGAASVTKIWPWTKNPLTGYQQYIHGPSLQNLQWYKSERRQSDSAHGTVSTILISQASKFQLKLIEFSVNALQFYSKLHQGNTRLSSFCSVFQAITDIDDDPIDDRHVHMTCFVTTWGGWHGSTGYFLLSPPAVPREAKEEPRELKRTRLRMRPPDRPLPRAFN